VDVVVREDTPTRLELEVRAPAQKRKLAVVVLALLVVGVGALSVLALFLVRHVMVLVPIALLLATAIAAGYAPYSWLFGRIRISVDSQAISSRFERIAAFFDTNTFLETVRELHPRPASNPDPLFGRYEVVAIRSDMETAWVALDGLESLDQATDIATRVRARLGLPIGETQPGAPANPGRPLGRTLLGLAASGLVASIASFVVCLAVAPRGEALARADLVASRPVTLELAAGDRLRFYVDVEIDETTHPNTTLKGLESTLAETKLRVRLVPASGQALEQECVIYTGVAEHKRGGLDGAAIVGMSNACRFVTDAAGRHTLHAVAAWSRNPRVATLRIHRE
jgi:hypothetical protein